MGRNILILINQPGMKLYFQIFQIIIVTYTFQATGLNGLSFHQISPYQIGVVRR